MIPDRSNGIERLLLLCQCVLVTAAYWAWFVLCYSLPIGREAISRYSIYNEFALLGLLATSWWRPLRSALHAPGLNEISRRSFRQFGGTILFLLLYLAAAEDNSISRIFFFSFMPFLYLILYATNRFLPAWLGRMTFKPILHQKVLLVGPKPKALEVKRWLDRQRHLGLDIIGLLSESNDDVEADPLPTLGRPADIERMLAQPGIMHVVMVEFPRTNGSLSDYTRLCEKHGTRLLVVADLDKLFGHRIAVFEDEGMFFLGLREEPLEDPVNRFHKRCLDIAVSLPVVVFILPPLIAMTWLFQRFQSPGPVFFIQPREGIQKRPFRVFKFRSMHTTDSANLRRPASKHDPRLYPFGRFMRKTSMDEIPQFVNVLRGDMSVVGPRPHLASYAEGYYRICKRAYVRNFVKPGITGIAQVNEARGCPETPELVTWRIQSDIDYLENWSIWLDAWLILRTATQVFFPPKSPT